MLTRVALLLLPAFLMAQAPQANQLDLEGKGAEARQIFLREIDAAATPLAKANAQRAMAMSWAFEGNCAKAVEYEQNAIAYWTTREKDEPGNAFYQEGEIANEAARVCIDSGDLNAAATWYRRGSELGLKEPGIAADRRAVWAFRLQHAEARIAARRGDGADAEKHVALAKAALDSMTDSRRQQEAFLPYLTGYVAFYAGDFPKALTDLQNANQSDPFIETLLGQTYQKLGKQEEALACYRKALSTRAHNPPAAYAVRIAGAQLHK